MNEFYLSNDEIAVLAGVMGSDVVYGIKSEIYTSFRESHKDKIKLIMDHLIDRQLFYIDFDQQVHMQPELYDAMDTIIHASSILFYNDTYYYKKADDIYCLSVGRHLYKIKKCTERVILANETLEISETLTDKELSNIEEKLELFDEDSAYEYLQHKVKNASMMIELMKDNFEKSILEYYEWKDHHINIQEQIIIGQYHQKYFEIYQMNQSTYYQGGLNYANLMIDKMFRR